MKKGVSKQLLVAALLIVTGLGGAGVAHFTRPAALPASGTHKLARSPQVGNTRVLGASTEQSSPAPAASSAAVHPRVAVKAAAVPVSVIAAPVAQPAPAAAAPASSLPASECKPTDSCWQPTYSLPLPCLTDISPTPGSGKTVHALDGTATGTATGCSSPGDPASPQPTTDMLYGGYPLKWAVAAQDSLIDDWGMFNRESVSYAAYKVHTDYQVGRDLHDMPYWGGNGNANQWPSNALAAGIPVDATPSVGSIAISSAGLYGQAMYVLRTGSLNGLPAIYVGQYNLNYAGQYSEQWRTASGLQFIHF